MGEEILAERICALEISRDGFAEIFRRDAVSVTAVLQPCPAVQKQYRRRSG